MSLRTVLVGLLLASKIFSYGAEEPEIWRNPKVFGINKEKPHAEFTIYADKNEALKPLDIVNPWHSDNYQSLNGIWDFNWYGKLNEVPSDWQKMNTKVSHWNTIPVPGTWQRNGFDRLYYLNKFMPFEYNWDTGELAPGFREDEINQSKQTGYIPDNAQSIGCYRKWVDLSKQRVENRVVLRIGSVEAGVQVFINGKDVGYSQDSFTPAEFDISSYLTPGKNLIALKVYHWTDGSYMEVLDMVRYAGIYRDVFLRFEPKQHIRDIRFIGTPDQSLKKTDAVYDIAVSNQTNNPLSGAKLAFVLVPDGSTKALKAWSKTLPAIDANSEINVSGKLELNDVKLWSPDMPNLYTLITSLVDAKGQVLEVTRLDAGFKRFENIDGNLFLNGKRFFIYGVNRHDHHPVYGKHVPVENMIRDVELMKQNNINTVRTSHYPNDERWYYLCNRYGIALIDEANIESHGFEDIAGNYPQWLDASVARVENMIQRDKNNPSVFIWSLGNEQDWGWSKALNAQFDRAKEIDPGRLEMSDRGGRLSKTYDTGNSLRLDKPNTITPMYRAIEEMTKYLENRKTDKRPFFMCEYRHAMGNAVGALKEVWDMVYANEKNGVNGGCIWDWIDQGVEGQTADGTKYFQYGGDWGDKANQWNFCLNGLILADQGWTPKLPEVKKCYEPFTVKTILLEKGIFRVKNRLNQLSLDAFNVLWKVSENGVVVQSGVIKNVSAPPGDEQDFNVPFDLSGMKDDKEYFLRISFTQKEKTRWADKDDEVTFSEYKLMGNFSYAIPDSKETPDVKEDDHQIEVNTSNGVVLHFVKSNGLLNSLKIKGYELFAQTNNTRLFDHSMAWIDNLYNTRNNVSKIPAYAKYDLDHLSAVGPAAISVQKGDGKVIVTVKNIFMSAKKAGFEEVQNWTIFGDGKIELSEVVSPSGEINDKTWVARIGVRFPLKPELDHVCYYGKGPQENYSDRSYGAWMGIFSSTVMDNYIPYPKPQDHGNREQVRWMKVFNSEGEGVEIVASTPLSMSVLPYSVDELKAATHTIDLPKIPKVTELRVAAKVTGIGNGSCGPITDLEYQVTAAKTEYKFYILPLSKK